MENTSYVALSRQAALWRQMEVVANNIANANTPAYKTEEVMFTDYLVKSKSANSPFGNKVSFVRDVGTMRDTREGALTTTGAPLDVAVHDDGYMVVDTPAGQRYTREGHFRLDENGMMVTSSGYPVMQKTNQPIVFAPNEAQINIAADGTISTENGTIGQLRVVKFDNEQTLRKAGDGTYVTSSDPTDIDTPKIMQGMLEESNVQPVIESTHMMTILRNYQSVQKMIENEQDRSLKAFSVLSQAQHA